MEIRIEATKNEFLSVNSSRETMSCAGVDTIAA